MTLFQVECTKAKKLYVVVDMGIGTDGTTTRIFHNAFLVAFAYYYMCGMCKVDPGTSATVPVRIWNDQN